VQLMLTGSAKSDRHEEISNLATECLDRTSRRNASQGKLDLGSPGSCARFVLVGMLYDLDALLLL
jgi:hypothetical protein